MSSNKPQAYVSVKKDRRKVYENLKTEYGTFGRAIFLNDGDEFEIELDNPTQDSYLAKIELNGKAISQSGIVVRPGEHIYLERFIDEAKKFLFDTYMVPGENKGATKKNGIIKVTFHKEQTGGPSLTITSPPYNPGNPWRSPTPWDRSPYWIGDGSYWTYTSGRSGILGSQTIGGTAPDDEGNEPFVARSMSAAYYSAPQTGGATLDSMESSTFETGRVEQGEDSDQTFEYVNMNFEHYATYTTEIKLLAYSNKPKTADDLRVYCTGCGAKMKKSWKFCAHCGDERP